MTKCDGIPERKDKSKVVVTLNVPSSGSLYKEMVPCDHDFEVMVHITNDIRAIRMILDFRRAGLSISNLEISFRLPALSHIILVPHVAYLAIIMCSNQLDIYYSYPQY